MLYSGVVDGEDNRRAPIAIVGPTAIGKTAVGIELASLLDGHAEIVSLDSMQVYRHMDIGTAKPSPLERIATQFTLIDVVDPDQAFTLADFQALATSEIERIQSEGKTPLLVGGTGLYFRAVTTKLDIPETAPDIEFRSQWQATVDAGGIDLLRSRLSEVDAAAATKIHGNDVRRMIRALEVFEKTGKPMSAWHEENQAAALTAVGSDRYFCLDGDRNELYGRIERRVEFMVGDGFIEEVESLRSHGYTSALKSMQSLGYKQFGDYLDGNLTKDDAIQLTKNETRQFARRQLIWFRGDKRLRWFNADDQSPRVLAEQILASVNKK